MKKNWYLVRQADGETRTAGSDKHNEPQQYCAHECVAHARRVGGGGGTVGSICDRLLRTWCEENRHIHLGNNLPIRTFKIRPFVLKPGKSFYPLPPENNFERLPRAPECTDRAETSINVSGRASCARAADVFPKSARTKKKVCESTKN